MIEKFEHMAMLYDFYGKLLTEKQQDILSLYYEQDLSLGEIAEDQGVSRQAVHDILKRTEKILLDYEDKLGLVKKFNFEREKMVKILELVESEKDNKILRAMIKDAIHDIIAMQND